MGNIDELIGKLTQDMALVRPAPPPFLLSIAWMAGAAVYLAVTLMMFDTRHDLLLKFHDTWFVAEIATLVSITIATSFSAALLSYPDLHQMRRIVFAPVVMFLLFVLVMIFALRADDPPASLPIHNFECTLSIAMFSLLPAAWTLYVMRKFASTHYRWAGTTALLYAFSVGAMWVRLHEQADSIIHVIEWHYLPMIGFGLVGMWLGKAVLKW
jgi:hypothetical protein